MFGMKLRIFALPITLIPYALGFPHLGHFPEYQSLVGLSSEEVRAVARSFSQTPGAQPLPPPVTDTSAKLVNDAAHLFLEDQPGDIRGPCPGLNTLASHGYLDRTGVATPGEIITAVQEGFNMGYNMAAFITYGAFIVDGNHLTNLMSIGPNTTESNELTPGLSTHGHFEGDASATRGDYYFGDNHSFNETLFDQLVYTANLVGNGFLTVESSSLQKALRINDSIARNPTFEFETPRYLSAFTETSFPLAFFVSDQTLDSSKNVPLASARSFFQDYKYPDGFVRRQAPYDFAEASILVGKIANLIGVKPGRNQGVGNYVVNPDDDGTVCYAYQKQVLLTAQLYPDPAPELKTAIKANLATFHQTVLDPTCEQLFPYGR